MNRTPLRFYRPFVSKENMDAAAGVMSGHTVAHLKFKLGLLTSRFGASHPLKACPDCHREGVGETGWSHWRLEQQFPGVWICPEHGRPLLQLNAKSNGIERFSWQVPRLERLVPASKPLSVAADSALNSFSGLVTTLVQAERPSGWLTVREVRPVLIARLGEMGVLTAGGNVRMSELAPEFLGSVKPLREIPELAALAGNLDEATTQIGRLLRPPRAGTHPLRILAAIHWLFEDAASFIQFADRTREEPAVPLAEPQGENFELDLSRADVARHTVLQLTREGLSARAAAREAGVDVNTALGWMANEGVTVRRRPKKMSGELRRMIVAGLRRGSEKVDLSKTSGMSVVSITRVLLSEPGLKARWDHARAEARRKTARSEWARTVKLHPELGIKLVRAMVPGAYAWLYRHDRNWLSEHSPAPADQLRPRASSVKWDERDLQLCVAVERAALAAASTHPGKGVRMQDLVLAVPQLRAKLRVLDRLPLTHRAIATVLGRRLNQSPDGLDISAE